MNSKVFVCDAASLLESDLFKLDKSDSLRLSTHFINPLINSLINKTIIVDLPLDLNFERLKRFNRIISRFPIDCDDYELVEFDLPEDIDDVKDEKEVSCLILNKYLLSDLNYVDKVKGKKFLLGVEPITKNKLNLVGYLLIKSSFQYLFTRLDES